MRAARGSARARAHQVGHAAGRIALPFAAVGCYGLGQPELTLVLAQWPKFFNQLQLHDSFSKPSSSSGLLVFLARIANNHLAWASLKLLKKLGLNTQYMTNPTIVSPVKMEYG